MKNFSTIGEPVLETNHLNQSRNNQIKFNRSKPYKVQFEKSFFNKQSKPVSAVNPNQLSNVNYEPRVNRIKSNDEESTSVQNARNIMKKQKLFLLEPMEKCESELERVFKVRGKKERFCF